MVYKKIVAIIFCALLLNTGFAAIYYISPAGNDNTGNGSKGKPWRSLVKATTMVVGPGDIIHVSAGMYTESAVCVLAPGVSIEGEGTSSIIQSTVKADWTPAISARSHEGTDGNQHISNLKLDGSNLSTFWAIWIAGRSNVSVYGCTITDFKDRGVIFDGRNDNNPGPPQIFATGNSFHDNIVSNCAAYNTSNGVYGRGCLNIGGQDGMVIYNNTITQDSRPDGYNGWPIKYSNDGYLKGVKIYKNILNKIPFTGEYGGDNGWDFTIELWNTLGGIEIYENTIQGAIDLVNAYKNNYPFGAWVHNNVISQKTLNSFFESGIVCELTIESVIIEENTFNKVAGGVLFHAQENSDIRDIVIRKNIFTEIGKSTGNGNNGNGIYFNCGTLFGNSLRYTVNNVLVSENRIVAAEGNAPFYGIEITGAPEAANINIEGNTIEKFRVAFFLANPASVIDSLKIENNKLTGNGNSNNPMFILGTPGHYSFKSNIKKKPAQGGNPGFDIKQQLLRPAYYELKSTNLLIFLAVFAMLLALFLGSIENHYLFPMGIFAWAICSYLNIQQDALVQAGFIAVLFLPAIYGWFNWRKRDKKMHRIVRVSASSKNEWLVQAAIFISMLIIYYILVSVFNKSMYPGTIVWADALVAAAAFNTIWGLAGKKVESWYWAITACIIAIPLYMVKHYLLISGYAGMLLLVSIWGLYEWRKRKTAREGIAASAKVGKQAGGK